MKQLVFYGKQGKGKESNAFCVKPPKNFKTEVPLELDLHRDRVHAVFRINSDVAKCTVDIQGQYIKSKGWQIKLIPPYRRGEVEDLEEGFNYTFSSKPFYNYESAEYEGDLTLTIDCPNDVEITTFYHGYGD